MNSDFDTIEYDLRNARCRGLVNRTAVCQQTMTLVSAKDVTKESGPFFCPSCLSEAIVRKCTEKVDHFAHRARLSPIIQAKDRELHTAVQNELLEDLKNLYPSGNWQKERPIPQNDDKGFNEVIPDLSGRDSNKNPIAIEIQKSAYSIPKLYNKTVEYQKRNIYVLWIVPLREDLGTESFRPRLYEKYLHSLYYGRVYYYIPNQNHKIIPVHFSPAKRWIEENTWYDKDLQEQRTEGGYFLTYRTIKSPNYGNELNISSDFKTEINKGFQHKNVKKEIPRCLTLQDVLEKWWPVDEYKSSRKQKEATRFSKVFEEYDYFDDYDDPLE